MKRYLPLTAALLLIGFAGRARAQSNVGRIDGAVVSMTGVPLARVVVTATSPTQIGHKRVTQTNDAGEYHLLGLTPGTFVVRFEAPGLKDVVRENVHVGVNETFSLDMIMEATQVEETHVITSEREVVEVRKNTVGENFDSEFLKNMPLQNRSYQSVMDLAAGVTDISGGNPNVRGGASFNNNYTVDGLDTTDPVTHTFGTNFNFDAISEVQVQTAGLGAENSMTTGGKVNVVTKSGSNKFEADASVYYGDQHLVLKGPKEKDLVFSNLTTNLNVGGPIVKDKLWYFASFELDRNVSTLPPDQGGLLPHHPPREFLGATYLLKLTYSLNQRNKFTAWVQGDPATIDNQLQANTILPQAEEHQDQNSTNVGVTWESPITDKLFSKLTFGYLRGTIDVYPQSCNNGDKNCLNENNVNDRITGITSGTDGTNFHDVRESFRLSGEMSYFPETKALGTHELKTGFKFGYSDNPSSFSVPGNYTLTTSAGAPFRRTLFCTDYDPNLPVDYDPNDPSRSRCKFGTLKLKVTGTFFSYYLQDTWSPTRYIHITPGVAFDYGETVNYAGQTITQFVTVTPHINATWDATHDGKTSVRGGFNQYVDSGFLAVSSFVGRSHLQEICNYNPRTMQYDASCFQNGGVSGVTVGRPDGLDANGNPLGPKQDLSAPRTTEFFFGIDREIVSQFGLGAEFVYRRFDHSLEDMETNQIWDLKGQNVVGYKNGNPAVVFDLETPDAAYRRYYGATINARKYLGRMRVLGSWTISKTEGPETGFATAYLDNPTQSHFYYGPTPDDNRHSVKVQLSYDVTDRLLIGGNFSYSTGLPYSKFYFNNQQGDYTDYHAPRGMISNDANDAQSWREARLPDLTQFDLHLSYSVQQVAGTRMMLIFDVFNLLNARTPVALEARNLPSTAPVLFGDPTNLQQPLSVRVGARFVY
jgi:hypothetical protein